MINHFQQKAPNVFTPATNITYVQGETGAKGYPLANGYTMLLMDSEAQKFYIKQTDATGIPTMKKFKFEEIVDPEPEKVEYVTKSDFVDFENRIISLLQPPKETKTAKAKGGEADG
ncbi:hypothetical protein SAMN02910413_1703 [Pseudobutyrivibrio sp. C4]|uniref:hypothetical protein n=1 Tax=Pseudobutyrivibrio sp. C4 TaxID=1520803 RepID=UPI0008BE77EA|nr:hypothetical protein [Pseudobutyrivibrio sp. C4]SET06352.1 hypothetical protein SAMN02910413_1703 [Pseudobutyrivibrio sp. C4]